jgi:hypothetical protein
MSAKFTGSGNFKVDAGINYVKLKIDISWQDSATSYGLALKSLSFQADGRTVEWSRSDDNYSGKADRTFNLSGNQNSVTEVSVNYQSQDTPLKIDKKSDKKLVFYDGNDTDANVTITLSILESVPFTDAPSTPTGGSSTTIDNTNGCPPGPWSQPVPPSCGSPPSGISSSDGLQISKTGQNEITLNLKNYANKLVSLKITHSVDAFWTQSFGFSIPTCSDMSPDPGGTPYSKNSYSNSNITGTNTFYVYNVDGGDYDYKFTHSSIPGPAPTRQLYTKQCDTSCDEEGNCVTTCYCVPAGIETFSPWPYCPTGVAVSKNGGDRVQWQYEDGGGGNYDDQYVTVEVIGVRNAIGSTGAVCTSALKGNVWVPDSTQAGAVGNCIGDYRDHGDKIRFRIPSLRSSKTSLPDPVCYSAFRGISGAIPPGESLGSLSSEYSVLHIFDDDFNTTTSLVTGNGLIVTPQNLEDNYHSPYQEANPASNTSLGTLSRKYYTVEFTDETEVGEGANNINIILGQQVTASGLNTPITVFKKERDVENFKKMRVWFYISYQDDVQFTDDIIHIFDDDENVTIFDDDANVTSKLVNPNSIIITPQSLDDPGNGTVGYQTLNVDNKKHYLVTFSDETIVETGGANIDIKLNQNKTASGLTTSIYVSKKEKVDNKNLKVWFTAYDGSAEPGLERDNSFARDWSVKRTKPQNFSGNIFARNWYLSKVS